MSGCFENYEQTSKLTNRFELLQEALKTINADFVGLIDTFKWKETFSEVDLVNKFGYKDVFHIDMDDTRVEQNIGVAVLTNREVKKFNVIRAHNRNYIETVLDGVNIYTCYFDDLSEDTRLLEVKSLLEQVKVPAVIHGDLNTFTSADLTNKNMIEQEFIVNNPELNARLRPILDDMKRGEVIEKIKAQGFIDTQPRFVPTMPSKAFPAVVTGPFVRVDYIFHSKELSSKGATVHRGELFDNTSDHYPISATLQY